MNPADIKALDMFRTDPQRAENGDWIDLPGLPCKRLKVTGQATPKAQAMLAKLTSQIPAQDRADAEQMVRHGERIKRNVLASCLHDWEGFTDDKGDALPIAIGQGMLRSGQYGHFVTIVDAATKMVGELREDAVEDAAKN